MMETNQAGCELKISEKAATEFLNMCIQEGRDLEISYLRVGAKSGGCSGWKYSLDYEDNVDSTDLVFEQHGVNLVVDNELLNNIMGDVEVDYKIGNLVEQGFVFNRLKFGHVCGCGESFTPLKDIKDGKEQLGWQ
jgi:iron-sulfur cluster assembly protein